MLTRERPTVSDDQVGACRHEVCETRLTAGSVQAEAHPQVDAALAEVAIRDATHPHVAQQLMQLREVPGKTIGRNGSVLETRPGGRTIRQPRSVSGTILADPPEGALCDDGREYSDVAIGIDPAKAAGKPKRMVPGLGRGITACLDEQPRPGRHGQQLIGWPLTDEREQFLGQALHGVRLLSQQRRHGACSLDIVVEPEYQQARRRWWCPEAHRGTGDDHTGPLGTDERTRNVEPALRQQPVERIARYPSRPGCQLRPDQTLVGPREPAQRFAHQSGRWQRQLTGPR